TGSSLNTRDAPYRIHFSDPPPDPICVPHFPSQITETTLEVTQSTKEVDTARSRLLELRRSVQSLEIDLDALRSQNAGLEGSLAETEARYGMQLEQLQGLILRGEEELAQARGELQRQNREHCALLDAKNKLEAEIATYRALLEGGEGFRWDGVGVAPQRDRSGAAGTVMASGWGESHCWDV
ncbi:K1C18 protein, partial [Odontophorus gujanensis]|nr:K1C18 protein [Odontophorus gujanensis]